MAKCCKKGNNQGTFDPNIYTDGEVISSPNSRTLPSHVPYENIAPTLVNKETIYTEVETDGEPSRTNSASTSSRKVEELPTVVYAVLKKNKRPLWSFTKIPKQINSHPMKFEKMHEIVYSSKIAHTRNIIGIGYHNMLGVCTTVLIYCTQLFSNKRSRPDLLNLEK